MDGSVGDNNGINHVVPSTRPSSPEFDDSEYVTRIHGLVVMVMGSVAYNSTTRTSLRRIWSWRLLMDESSFGKEGVGGKSRKTTLRVCRTIVDGGAIDRLFCGVYVW
ncbi:hypothetical protein ONS95_012901 [Cadophora gregata]|uniref:uncharacterized protein n=1 Tax=Cadophora gregata TaxID=51156 RepID=UPI0026DB9734|nr:uncharacterized protein ONS95_012901 [Cadophora gregata]KAK0115852.1 hypothetical protein ONS95_012901 [Cadophora gregata]